jgi:hypothetical protein
MYPPVWQSDKNTPQKRTQQQTLKVGIASGLSFNSGDYKHAIATPHLLKLEDQAVDCLYRYDMDMTEE